MDKYHFKDIENFLFENNTSYGQDFLDAYDGVDEDYYSDLYETSAFDEELKEQTIFELFINCIQPILQDSLKNFFLPILLANHGSILLINLLQYFNSEKFVGLVSKFILMFSGYYLLFDHYHEETGQLLFLIAVILLTSLSVPILLQLSSQKSFIWLLWCQQLSVISLNECFIHWFGWTEWIKIRPNLMLTMMKSISYYEETRLQLVKKDQNEASGSKWYIFETIIDFLSYLLHPCSIVLGMWHPHSSYSKLFYNQEFRKKTKDSNSAIVAPINKSNLLNSIGSLMLSIVFLLCSTCLIEYFINHIMFEYLDSIFLILFGTDSVLGSIKLLKAYSIAIQFHYSHYFICFLCQSMFDLWNLKLTVTKPLNIEWPRSLVEVVIAWNIPMHQWLKRYVFQILKQHFNNIYLTILTTYFISSYLHGFNFQIWSVLLTLGLLTQAEFKLRKVLAQSLSACVESRKCQYDYHYFYDHDDEDRNYINDHDCPGSWVCRQGHQRTEKQWQIQWMNFLFTFVALSNLAFLGATFDGQPNSSTIENVWQVSNELHFHSFIMMTIMYILYKTIKWTV